MSSHYHAYLGLSTIGMGLLTGHPFGVIVGAFAYAMGWLYLPDSNFFKKTIDDKVALAKKLEEEKKVEAFRIKQTKVLNGLNENHLAVYRKLKIVCTDIERIIGESSIDTQSIRLSSLDRLMWAYLRLLGMQEMLENFMDSETENNLDLQISDAKKDIDELSVQLKEAKEKADNLPSLVETKERVIKSKQDRLDAIKQRKERIELAKNNLSYVIAEQERLHEQIMLMRSDVMASRDAQSLSVKIDATVDHIEQANQIMKQFEGLTEMTDDLPSTNATRIGYGDTLIPIIQQSETRIRPRKVKEQN
jgi:hypothetical protein